MRLWLTSHYCHGRSPLTCGLTRASNTPRLIGTLPYPTPPLEQGYALTDQFASALTDECGVAVTDEYPPIIPPPAIGALALTNDEGLVLTNHLGVALTTDAD